MRKLSFKTALNIYSKITDGTHDSPKQNNFGYPLITSKHIKGRNIDFDSAYLISEIDYKKINERSQVDQWDVIISMIGEYCGFSYIERNDNIEYAVKNVGLFKTGSKLEAEWLYYYFNSNIGKQHLNSIKSGSTQPYLTLGGLRNLPILQTDFSTKISIVKILSSLDSKIELNNRINAELEAMAKTLYDYWFVQFDFPNEKGKPYKSSGGKMVWNAALKREVPVGWEVDFLGEFGVFKNGINYDPKLGGDTEAKIINIRNMSAANWFVSQHGLDSITLNENEVKNYLVTDNDILIARSGIPGATRIMYKYAINTIYCGFIIRYQVKEINLKNYLFFKLKDLEKSITSKSGGTIMSNVNQETLKTYKIVLASERLIKSFNKIIDPIFKAIDTNSQANQQLSELRDWLLPMLMNGQVKVRDAEEVEENLSMAAELQSAYGTA